MHTFSGGIALPAVVITHETAMTYNGSANYESTSTHSHIGGLRTSCGAKFKPSVPIKPAKIAIISAPRCPDGDIHLDPDA